MNSNSLVILGAGPSGLTAAHEAVRHGIHPVVLEKANMVGGISRTEKYKDYYFDVGGHRFFSKIEKINELWQEILGEDFIKVSRQSRIYYNGQFFHYPIRALNTISNLGIFESLLIVFSFIKSQIRPSAEEETFEQWITNRFGQRLYSTFFKTYTEKVWGIPCSRIRADWAAQRIKGLSLITAVYNALLGMNKAKTLIDEFDYPIKGPGMMWQRFQETVEAKGAQVFLNSETTQIKHENGRITSVNFTNDKNTGKLPVKNLISSIPITTLVTILEPQAPKEVLEAANSLTYRAFVIVVLIINKNQLFQDQWIYIHSPDVRVGRIQNFKNWSAAMLPDPQKTSVGMEYFCNEGDEIWTMPNANLTAMASRELSKLGFARKNDIIDGVVLRQPKAYPVYDQNYNNHLNKIRDYIEKIDNLMTIGRNGMHRYNNMDHSMLTGLMAVENLLGAKNDLWMVNEEEKYLEEEQRKIRLKQLFF